MPIHPTSGYHLDAISQMGGETKYSKGQKVLSFDTATNTVDITGSSNAMHLNGNYSFRVYDSVLTNYIPTLKIYVKDTVRLIDLGNLNGDLIHLWKIDSNELTIYADYSRGMADEEQWFHFTKY